MAITTNPRVSAYLDSITSRILSRRKAADIRREYLNHIEESVAAHMDGGMSEDQAVSLALLAFGRPVDISTAMNRVHKPILHIPLFKWLLAVFMIVAIHMFVFGGHVRQFVAITPLLLTIIPALVLVLITSNRSILGAAGSSLVVPVAGLSAHERQQACVFFSRFSRLMQLFCVALGAVAVGGIAFSLNDPSTIGHWVAIGFNSYVYGFVFAVLAAESHTLWLRNYSMTRHHNEDRVPMVKRIAVMIQGVVPLFILMGLIRIITTLNNPAVVWGGMAALAVFFTVGYLILRVCRNGRSFGKKVTFTLQPVYTTFPAFVILCVGLVMYAIERAA